MSKVDAATVVRELGGVSLGDRRLDARAKELVERFCAAPDDSFPEQMSSDAELEALYRFFANPKVTMEKVLAPHVEATVARMHEHPLVRVVHDTTSFRFDGDREGLGIINREVKGFYAHTSLAISGDEAREPLGVLAMRPYIHRETVSRRNLTPSERVAASSSKPRSERESSRWEEQAVAVASMSAAPNAIHLMDQEGDDFHVFAELHRRGIRFVIRANPARRTSEEVGLKDVLARQPSTIFRSVRLTERKKTKAKHPARAEREAALQVRWGVVQLQRPRGVRVDVEQLSLYAVHVFEPSPPEGQDAIEWMLLTTEPVKTLENATSVVDHYRARWIIEEYFKALKTGCAFEKRQLTTFDGLTGALGLFVPIAWRLLLLRHLSRAPETSPASRVMDHEELLLLRALLDKRGRKAASLATTRDVMLAIAALGGHIKNNGDPGWIVLGRGFIRFAEAKIGWDLARRCDQS